MGEDTFPQVFEPFEAAPDAGTPPEASGLDAATLSRAVASTVKVEGVSAGSMQDGSGFTVDRDLVVTNAHVVAGQDAPQVQRPDGQGCAPP